jgi:hypothetical protein
VNGAIRHFAAAGLVLSVLAAAPAAAQTIEILASDPASGATLTVGEPLYVRIRYASDQPLRFRARAYRAGVEQTAGSRTNPSPVYGAGNGEAVAWIEFVEPTTIDEIRVLAYDEHWQALTEIEQDFSLEWRAGARSATRSAAAWVASLNAAQQRMTSSQTAASSSDTGAWWGLLMMMMAWSVPGYLILQIYVYRRWREGWRTAGLLPLWLTVPIMLYSVLALMHGSNLWPLAMLFTYPLAFLYLVALTIVRRFVPLRGAP